MNASLEMALRDWFAGMAMQGLVGDPHVFIDDGWARVTAKTIAEEAYKQADAMLAAREDNHD